MNISEAAKLAVENGKCIITPEFKRYAKIKPTNGIGNCIVMNVDGSHQSKYGWQPTARDLIRNDWELVD